MRKLKGIIMLSVILATLFLFSIKACAVNMDDYFKKGIEASGAGELADYLDKETREYLEKIGFEETEYEKILSADPKAVFELITDILKGKLNEPLKGAVKAVSVIILGSVCGCFVQQDEKQKQILNIVCGSFLIISVFSSAFVCIRAGAGAIGTCAAFEKALIPVLAGIVTASGNPALAFSVQGTAFAAAQIIESLSENIILPLTGAVGALGMIGAMVPSVNLGAIAELIKKTSTTVLASAASLFTGFLTMKSVVAGAADRLATRGIRLAAGTFIPVIGSALGEAYSSVMGSLSLVRSAVGVYAIAAFALICIPAAAELSLWSFSMRAASAFSDLLGGGICSDILKSAGYMFSTVNILLILGAVVFIITAGILITVKVS